MKIQIETIEHEQHRYPTVGDWWFDDEGTLQIRVSKMSDTRFEALVAVHELIEVLICKQRGITAEEVDAFDKAFEAARIEGDESEPGDSPNAPYRKEHFFATNVEALLSAELEVDWAVYEREVNSL